MNLALAVAVKNIKFDLPSEQFFEKIDKLFYEDKFHLVNKEVVEVFSK